MRTPEEVVNLLRRKFERHHRRWLAGEGDFPDAINLHPPVERDVMTRTADVRTWISAWNQSELSSHLIRESRTWARAGAHEHIPVALALASPEIVCKILGQGRRWERATHRYHALTDRWPDLKAVAAAHFNVLADYEETDFSGLIQLVDWLTTNRSSGYMLRQIPLEGLHSKWLETRTQVVRDFVAAILGEESADLYEMCGLSPLPLEIKTHILCPILRRSLGGWHRPTLPINELKTLAAHPRLAIVVENRDTGSALPDLEGAICFAAMGKAVNRLGELPWLHDVPLLYWSDIDTHGFECVDLARQVLPRTQTILMDVPTVERFRHLVSVEESPLPASRVLRSLTSAEREVYEGLHARRWGTNFRIEQERLPISFAMSAIQHAIRTFGSHREDDHARASRLIDERAQCSSLLRP